MPKRIRREPALADVVALAHALDRDQQRPAAELTAREKRIAAQLPAFARDPVVASAEEPTALALEWLEAAATEDDTVRTLRQRAETALHLTTAGIVLAAIVLGWSATLGAFYFDGSGRVNAVAVLAVLVVVPGILLLPFALVALPERVAGHVPGLGVVTALARGLSPGRLAPLVWRVLPRELRESLALLAGRAGRHQQVYATLQKWALLRWSQLFALTFQLTALIACLALVVFTDLAFGWSTTLTTGQPDVDAARVHRITAAMARPWSWAVPDAAPSRALIAESRYFRVAGGQLTAAQAARLGGWWQFVAFTLAVYGVLPRVITVLVAEARLRAAIRAGLQAMPGLSAVRRRLHRARVESAALLPEPGATAATQVAAAPVAAERNASEPVRAVINWAGVPVRPERLASAFPGAPVFAAGGDAAVTSDAAVVRQVAALLEHEAGGDVVILVKAWEPPLMEFLDFLMLLRDARGRRPAGLVVLPVGLSDEPDLTAAPPAQVNLWRGQLARVPDPWLRVAPTLEEVSR